MARNVRVGITNQDIEVFTHWAKLLVALWRNGHHQLCRAVAQEINVVIRAI